MLCVWMRREGPWHNVDICSNTSTNRASHTFMFHSWISPDEYEWESCGSLSQRGTTRETRAERWESRRKQDRERNVCVLLYVSRIMLPRVSDGQLATATGNIYIWTGRSAAGLFLPVSCAEHNVFIVQYDTGLISKESRPVVGSQSERQCWRASASCSPLSPHCKWSQMKSMIYENASLVTFKNTAFTYQSSAAEACCT